MTTSSNQQLKTIAIFILLIIYILQPTSAKTAVAIQARGASTLDCSTLSNSYSIGGGVEVVSFRGNHGCLAELDTTADSQQIINSLELGYTYRFLQRNHITSELSTGLVWVILLKNFSTGASTVYGGGGYFEVLLRIFVGDVFFIKVSGEAKLLSIDFDINSVTAFASTSINIGCGIEI